MVGVLSAVPSVVIFIPPARPLEPVRNHPAYHLRPRWHVFFLAADIVDDFYNFDRKAHHDAHGFFFWTSWLAHFQKSFTLGLIFRFFDIII